MKIDNFVRGTITDPLGLSGSVNLSVSTPYRPPPNPAGQATRVTITDSLRAPTAFEIITYTTSTELAPGQFRLTGVQRGQEGTAAQSWPTGSVITQDVTAGMLALLALQEQTIFVYGVSADTTVRKIGRDGEQIWVYPGAETAVRHVSAALDGSCFIGSEAGWVRKVSSQGALAWAEDRSAQIRGLAARPDGSVFVAYGSWFVGVIGAAGALSWSFDLDDIFVSGVTGVDVDEDGRCLTAGTGEIVLFDPDGALVRVIPEAEVPLQAQFGPGGIYYIRGADSALVKVDLGGNVIWESTTHSFDTAFTIGAGSIYAKSGSIVRVIDAASGAQTGTLTPPIGLNGLRYGADGFLYMFSNDRIAKVSMAGAMQWEFNDFFAPVFNADVLPVSEALAVKYGTPPTLGRIDYSEVTNKPTAVDAVRIQDSPVEPAAPPSGRAYMFFSGAELKVKFSNGATTTIADDGTL